MSLYKQLALIPEFFPIKQTQVTANGNSTTKLVDITPTRIYLAFLLLSSPSSLTLIPADSTFAAAGFQLAINTSIEFWIEKHKSMVPQKWFANNAQPANVTVTIIEVLYKIPPENYDGETVNAEASERPDRLFRSDKCFAEDDRRK